VVSTTICDYPAKKPAERHARSQREVVDFPCSPALRIRQNVTRRWSHAVAGTNESGQQNDFPGELRRARCPRGGVCAIRFLALPPRMLRRLNVAPGESHAGLPIEPILFQTSLRLPLQTRPLASRYPLLSSDPGFEPIFPAASQLPPSNVRAGAWCAVWPAPSCRASGADRPASPRRESAPDCSALLL